MVLPEPSKRSLMKTTPSPEKMRGLEITELMMSLVICCGWITGSFVEIISWTIVDCGVVDSRQLRTKCTCVFAHFVAKPTMIPHFRNYIQYTYTSVWSVLEDVSDKQWQLFPCHIAQVEFPRFHFPATSGISHHDWINLQEPHPVVGGGYVTLNLQVHIQVWLYWPKLVDVGFWA